MMQDSAKKERIGEELADVFYFTLRFAQKFGFDLSDELRSKPKKNAEKYPIEKAKGSNKSIMSSNAINTIKHQTQ